MKTIVVQLNTTVSLMTIRSFREETQMEDMLDNDYNPRTVQIWLDDSFMEIELNQPKDWDEDRFYEEAVNYVLSNISIDIL